MQLSCSQRRRSQTYEVSAIRATCLLLISMYMSRVHPCCYMDIYIYNRPTRFRSTRVILISHRHAIYIYICIVTYIFWAWISLGSSIIYKLERFNEPCHFDDSIKIALTKIRFTFAFQVESKNLVYSVIVVRNVARRILRTG